MAENRTPDSENTFQPIQNQNLADSAVRNRKQSRTYRKVWLLLRIQIQHNDRAYSCNALHETWINCYITKYIHKIKDTEYQSLI